MSGSTEIPGPLQAHRDRPIHQTSTSQTLNLQLQKEDSQRSMQDQSVPMAQLSGLIARGSMRTCVGRKHKGQGNISTQPIRWDVHTKGLPDSDKQLYIGRSLRRRTLAALAVRFTYRPSSTKQTNKWAERWITVARMQPRVVRWSHCSGWALSVSAWLKYFKCNFLEFLRKTIYWIKLNLLAKLRYVSQEDLLPDTMTWHWLRLKSNSALSKAGKVIKDFLPAW